MSGRVDPAALESVAIGLYESRVRATSGWTESGLGRAGLPSELDVRSSLHALMNMPAWQDLPVDQRRAWRTAARALIAEQDSAL